MSQGARLVREGEHCIGREQHEEGRPFQRMQKESTRSQDRKELGVLQGLQNVQLEGAGWKKPGAR